MTYTITTTNYEKRFTVEANNYTDAAIIAARKLLRRKTVTAGRTTGNNAMSGYFRAYEHMRGGGLNSCGEPFHVSEN